MKTATIKASGIATLAITIISITNVSSAFAFPDPGEPDAPAATQHTVTPCGVGGEWGSRGLGRIGTQFVRGDDLTGADVAAPPWVPEALG